MHESSEKIAHQTSKKPRCRTVEKSICFYFYCFCVDLANLHCFSLFFVFLISLTKSSMPFFNIYDFFFS